MAWVPDFLPATKAIPKEMLPVVDKPLIQYAVEEAYAAGIREMIFVTGRHKRAIEDHFDTAYELESELEAAGKQALLELVQLHQTGRHGLCLSCDSPSPWAWVTRCCVPSAWSAMSRLRCCWPMT